MKNSRIVDIPVLIVGAGAAGLRVAIELAGNGVECLVVGKRAHGDAHTRLAAGGINASLGSLDAGDEWSLHAADTLREGHFVGQPKAVELLARLAPERVLELQRWGCPFDTLEDGRINQRYFGAQTFRRTCFVGDRTGQAILDTLVRRARELDVAYREGIYVTTLLRDEQGVVGAVGWDMNADDVVVFHCRAVVLAAGGMTGIYNRSSSRVGENTADNIGLAMGVGAAVRDMEFVQFHPTGMVGPEEFAGQLVTEAVRGEGGRLFNSAGERFMERYAPEEMELAARDVVARAIYGEVRAGRGTENGGVWLDISHRKREFIKARLPDVFGVFEGLGIDMSEEAVEVAPTAHYAMGGVKVDFETGATGVEGLFAVGEATGGLHGANRLGGNSLAETVVFGQLTGAHLVEQLSQGTLGERRELPREEIGVHVEHLGMFRSLNGSYRPRDIAHQLGELMWEQAGIVRTEAELWAGLEEFYAIGQCMGVLSVRNKTAFECALNLRFMFDAAEMVFRGALMREESRGAHFREDAPTANDAWQQSIVYRRDEGGLGLAPEPVGRPSKAVQEALDLGLHLDYHHLE